MTSDFYSRNDLIKLGFREIGTNVNISKKASIYNFSKISLGSNIRIDDFCLLSAGEFGINIGSNVHIACYVSLIGQSNITLDDFCGLSSKVAIYSSNDDYSGNFLSGPTVPLTFRNVVNANVRVGKHVIVGAFSTILPGVTIHDGSAIGAYSLVNRDIEGGIIAAGVPAKKMKSRSHIIFDLEKKYKEL